MNTFVKAVSIFLLGALLILSCTPASKSRNLPDGLYAEIITKKGNILLQLHYEKVPMTVTNFVGLVEGKLTAAKGKPFYDGLKFHRVVENFMIQGGDPAGDGSSGPGYSFPDEIDPTLKHDAPGILSMANRGPATNGSQFFITHVPTPWLDGMHTIFGKVVEGQAVVDSIKQNDSIDKITILRIGKAAQDFKPDQAKFDALVAEATKKQQAKQADEAANLENVIKQKWPTAIKTASGLMYVVTKEGTGGKPKQGQSVTAHYTGTLLDGTKFDSSVDRGEPIEFPVGVGQVIPGWDEALLDMKKDEKRTLIIPYQLAYGEAGRPPVIPPRATLVFDVELVNFK